MEALVQTRARGRRAWVGLRVASAAVHRLRGGLGGVYAARRLGGDRTFRTWARSCPYRGLDVSGVLAGSRALARERGVPLVELRRSIASASERERRPVRLLPRRGLCPGCRWASGAGLVRLPDDRPFLASGLSRSCCYFSPVRSRARSCWRAHSRSRLAPSRASRPTTSPARGGLCKVAGRKSGTPTFADPGETQARSDERRQRKAVEFRARTLAVLREGSGWVRLGLPPISSSPT